MNFYDFIKIRGLIGTAPDNVNPGTFEIFQGLGAELISQQTVDSETGLVPVAPSSPIPDALWEGQNGLLQGEIEYCDQLSDLWKRQKSALPQETNIIWSFVQELLEGFLGVLVGGLVAAGTDSPALGKVAMFLAEALVGVAIEKLRDFFTKGVALCDGIQAEDESLLLLDASRENYELRSRAISQHTEQLENVLNLINTMESILDRTVQQGLDTKGIVKALKPIKDELPEIADSLEKIDQLTEAIETIQEDHAKLRLAVQDLALKDVEIQFGDDLKARIKGKALEF